MVVSQGPTLPQFRIEKINCAHIYVLQNKLGGGEGVEGLYGSITQSGTQKIFASMGQHCSLDSDSALVDIGAGLGR